MLEYGDGIEEIGIDDNGRVLVEVDEQYYRPTEVDVLVGNSMKAKEKLGWESRTEIDELVRIMMK